MSYRRMLPFILINIVVSAVVVLSILYWWDNRQANDVDEVIALGTAVATSAADGLAAPEGVPQATETPEPGDEPPLHIVQAGDTLGRISQFYDVSIDDIMAANGLTNPNILSVGQQLIIPVGGLPTPEPAPTATPATDVLPTPIPTPALPNGEAMIEISQVIGVGELGQEAVQIRNVGNSPVALQNWKLADQDGHVYTFGQVTLFGDGAGILVHTAAGRDGATEVYWGMEQAVWRLGELVTLLNAEGEIVATYTIP